MDIADQAQIEIERSLERSLSARRPLSGMGPEMCRCGETIPQKRREGGYRDCIHCAREKEVNLGR